jgi:hypothetical protein
MTPCYVKTFLQKISIRDDWIACIWSSWAWWTSFWCFITELSSWTCNLNKGEGQLLVIDDRCWKWGDNIEAIDIILSCRIINQESNDKIDLNWVVKFYKFLNKFKIPILAVTI